MSDALSIVEQARPPRPSWSPEMRVMRDTPISTASGDHTASELNMSPANPSFRSRIPPPPCAQCNQDHFPGKEYNHPYVSPDALPNGDAFSVAGGEPLPEGVAVRPVSVATPTAPAPAQSTSSKRIAVYPGRGEDAFIVCVEAAPEWDTEESWKLDGDHVLPLLPVLRAMGIKISDKTGGDLHSLEMDRRGS